MPEKLPLPISTKSHRGDDEKASKGGNESWAESLLCEEIEAVFGQSSYDGNGTNVKPTVNATRAAP